MNIYKKLTFQYIRMKLNILYRINPVKAGQLAFRLFTTPIRFPRKNSEIFLNASSIKINVDGKMIKGAVFNSNQTRKALILHGFSSSKEKFDYYVQPLIDKNYQVFAFDAPAHGESEGKTVNAVEYAAMIKKINNDFGKIDAYISHSFGGLALSLALEEMEHDHQTKVVLIAPATETTTAIDSAFKVIGVKNSNIKTSMKDIIYNLSGKTADWYSVRRALHNVKADILWVHDKDDDTTPINDALRVKEDNHQNIKFYITEGLGHSRIYKNETTIKQIIDFF